MSLSGPTILLLSLGILQAVAGHPTHPTKSSFQNVTLGHLSRGHLNPSATSLDIQHSKIGAIEKNALDGLVHLNRLEISDSEIAETIDPQTFAGLPGLEILVLKRMGLKRVQLNLTNVQRLDLAGNEIEAFDGRAAIGRNLNFLDLSENKLKVLGGSFSNLSKLSVIDVSRNQISHVMPAVFEGNLRLLRIFAGENKIASTEGFRLHWLKTLDLFANKIETLDSESFAKMAALEELVVAFNEIKRVDDPFKDLVELKYLNLAWNKIEQLSPGLFRNNLYLTELSLQGNRIKSLEKFEGDHHHLSHLDLSHNQISQIDDDFFRSTPGLHVLNLAFNRLKTLSGVALVPLMELQILNLAYNNFDKLNLSSNSELTRVNLSSNVLRDGVSLFLNNPRLTEVDLSGNEITNFCDGNLTLKSLMKAYLKGNQIGSLTCLQEFPSLCEVDLRDNPLTCGEGLDRLILDLAERKASPYNLVPEFQAEFLPSHCENLSLNKSFHLWNSIKHELCPNGRDEEPRKNATVSEWEESDDVEKIPTDDGDRKESVEEGRVPTVKIYVHRPVWQFRNDEMNKPNPMENPQSGRQSWGNIEENSELLKGFEDEEMERRPRFSWYTIALILIGLSLTLTCFNLLVFLYIRMKVWKRKDAGSPQKYVVLQNEVYKNTTEPSPTAGDGDWPTENETRNKIFTYGKINEILLNFGLNKKDKDAESDKNILIHSSSNSQNF